MRDRGVPTVLGLRDVMDDPDLLEPEWERKNVMPALQDLFDAIWVYGLPQIHDPLAGINVPDSVRRKMTYTGYLRREVSSDGNLSQPAKIDSPYILVTPGGGGESLAGALLEERKVKWKANLESALSDISCKRRNDTS